MVKNFYAVVNDKNKFLKESITGDWNNERIEGQFYNVISESLYNYLKNKSKILMKNGFLLKKIINLKILKFHLLMLK